jgi:molybdopterin-guanine dinucleotide biosynthesis protein A
VTIEPGGVTEGFVLAGGQASRMGCDKSMLIYQGKTLLDHAVAVLKALGLEVRVVGESEDPVRTGFVPTIPDLQYGLGPIGGIYTALNWSNSAAIFVLACDMPLVPVELLRALLETSVESDVVVPRDSLGRLHPLCGVYSTACLQALETGIGGGQLSMRDLLNMDGLKITLVDTVQYGFPDHVFLNVNSPEDYSALLDADFED